MLIVAVMIVATFAAAVPSMAIEGLAISEVEAPYFDVKPTIDGVVSPEEWGEPSVVVNQAEVENSKFVVEGDTPSANDYNTFFYRNPAATYDAENLNMKYTLWIRWDENFFYFAAKVNDPDGHSLKNGKNETWNGDAIQFRVDPEGYNASSSLGPDMYDADYDGKPWSRDDIDDFCIGFVESAGGFTEAWNNATNTGMTAFSGGNANVAVTPAGANFNADTAAGITTYEFAVPWGYIDSYAHMYKDYSAKDKAEEKGAIGKEYGMTAIVYNADGNSGEAKWNAALTWGSGILNDQQNNYTQTCGGSNKITLSGDKVSEDGTYTGSYATGTYVPPKPTPNYPLTIDESNHVKLDYEKESDMDIYGYNHEGEWVEEPGNPSNHVARWDLDPDSKSGFNENNYLATDSDVEGVNNWETADCSYTMEYDVKVTGVENFEPGYNSALYNWFGGASIVDYEVGYDFDLSKFTLVESASRKVLAEDPTPFALNEWHHIVFQYYKENSEMRYYFDPPMENGRVAKSAVPMFQMSYRYFDCPGRDVVIAILRRMNCQILLDNVEFYNFVDWSGTGSVLPPDPDPIPGPKPTPQPVDEDIDVDISDVEKRDDGTFAVGIPNLDKYKAANVTAVKFLFDLKKSEGKLTFKGVEGVDAAAVDTKDNGDGTVTITVKDLKIFANVETGKAVMKVILAPADGAELTEADVKGFVAIKATVTTLSAQTGDPAVMYVAIAFALAAVLGTGIVMYSKKRGRIDF